MAFRPLDVSGWTKIDEVPFKFERRRVSVLVTEGAKRLLAVKGAPKDVLRQSTHFEAGNADLQHLAPAVVGPRSWRCSRDWGNSGCACRLGSGLSGRRDQ